MEYETEFDMRTQDPAGKSTKNPGVTRPDSGEQHPTSPAACEGGQIQLSCLGSGVVVKEDEM